MNSVVYDHQRNVIVILFNGETITIPVNPAWRGNPTAWVEIMTIANKLHRFNDFGVPSDILDKIMALKL